MTLKEKIQTESIRNTEDLERVRACVQSVAHGDILCALYRGIVRLANEETEQKQTDPRVIGQYIKAFSDESQMLLRHAADLTKNSIDDTKKALDAYTVLQQVIQKWDCAKDLAIRLKPALQTVTITLREITDTRTGGKEQ